jgi:hypothetical protein
MFSTVTFSLISFLAGIIGTLLVVRILVGGVPQFPDGSPKCEDGLIKFQLNPAPVSICRCVGVQSFINGTDSLPHVPTDDPLHWHSRPSPPPGPAVTLKVICEYALFPTSTESVTQSVQPCAASSSSSSGGFTSSSSSSTPLNSSSSSTSGQNPSSSSSSFTPSSSSSGA